ncbi:MAG: tyrosine-type recombinase/integrase [Haloferacaceae archaeon]
MLTRPYDDRDGRKVWLSAEETDRLLDAADGSTQRLAFALGARVGRRSAEAAGVTPADLKDTDAGPMIRVREPVAKGEKYREAPVPPALAREIEAVAEHRAEPADAPIVDATTRTLRRWIETAREELAEQTDDPDWQYLGFHDLRRTRATALKSADVEPMLVCDWGGWSDLETFLDHYRGEFTLDAQRRERGKVGWL